MKRTNSLMFRLILISALALASAFAQTTLTTSPTSVSMTAASGGVPVQSSLQISSSVSGAVYSIYITYTSGVNWLTVNLPSGPTPATVTLTANPSGLPAGTYNATIVIGSGTTFISVPVTFQISVIGASPSSIPFTYQLGQVLPQPQPLLITSQSTIPFTVSVQQITGGDWLAVSPTAATSPVSLTLSLKSTVLSLPAGTYTANVLVSPTSVTSSQITVPVTLTVGSAPQMVLNPAALTFNYQSGGTNNVTSHVVNLSTNTGQSITYAISDLHVDQGSIQWLDTVTPTSGTIVTSGSQDLTVKVNASTLPTGTYTGSFKVNAGSVTNSPVSVPVLLNVSTTPLLVLPATTLTFTYQVGTTVPTAQTITPGSTGSAINYTVLASTNGPTNWLQVSTSSGVTGTGFQVSVQPTGLTVGTYTGTVTVSAGTISQQIPVTLKVSNDPAIVPFGPLTFLYQVGQSTPPAQLAKLTSTTGATLYYTASSSAAWLSLEGTLTGQTDATIAARANISGLSAQTAPYTAQITVRAYTDAALTNPAANSPLVVPVNLYVSTTPLLQSTASTLSFTTQALSTPSFQSFTLTSTNSASDQQITATLTTETDNGIGWILVGPQFGTTPLNVSVGVDPSRLTAGTYTGRIKISGTGPGSATPANSPVTIPVTVTITSGRISATPTPLNFTQTAGGAAPAAQTIQVTSDSTPLTFTAVASPGAAIANSWISVTPNSGTTPTTLTVTVDGSRLTPSTTPYVGTILITSPGASGSPITVPVNLTLNAATIAATPTQLTFTGFQGAAAPAAQTINISSSSGALSYVVTVNTSSGGNWLSLTPTSGTTPGSVSVTASPSGLAIGTYSGTVTITSSGATGSPITIPVSLTVQASQTLAVTPTSLTYTYYTGQTVPAQNLQVTSSGGSIPISVAVQTSSGGNWLSAPSGGTTPGAIAVSVSPQSLAAGTYNGTVTVSSPNAQQSVTVSVTLTVQIAPTPVPTNIVNAATFAPGAVAPGEFITLGGTGLGPDTLAIAGPDSGGYYPTTFSDTKVTFDGVAAPIYYVSARQTSVIVPYEVASRASTNMVVSYKGVVSQSVQLRVTDTSPGIYCVNQAGSGPGVIQNQNYSLNSASNPAAKGSVVVVYANGEGQTTPAGTTGQVIPADVNRLKRPLANVTATIGGVSARVLYAGSAPGLVSGVFQVNVEVPANAPSGAAVPIVINVGNTGTQAGVTMAVQ